MGLLFGVPASLFRWLPVDTDILSDFWRVYDKHGRKLPSSDAGADVADISVDACYEVYCVAVREEAKEFLLTFIVNYLIYLIYDSWFFFTFEANRKLKKKKRKENETIA